MTDMDTGWTENHSIRNNAGSEFINHDVAQWLQNRDIEQTRSRPYQKNDQATVESKNNHVVRKHAFYWRYDTPEQLVLLNKCRRWCRYA